MNRIFIAFVCISSSLLAQDKVAYQLYNKEGKQVGYQKMISELAKADVVYLGIHDTN